eukprot:CAMPEP_0197886792 /NCGR_PEP_ID=MMETSP1439-20131203/17712_1 /TAXON_ID=66791 /ORGANISM="Gonyaulax spinifera, Strain CCMP409" /LENGTH=350 /DNA_ID=CAMNT_0043506603 /DNA_START=47 /DNA_END=1096 /DNA_ORIENTATION=-
MNLVVWSCIQLAWTCAGQWTDHEALVQQLVQPMAISRESGGSDSNEAALLLRQVRTHLDEHVDDMTLSIMKNYSRQGLMFGSSATAPSRTSVDFQLPNVSWWQRVEKEIDTFRQRSREMALLETGGKHSTCGKNCQATIAVDCFMFALSVFGVTCGPATLMIYYSLGLATLVEEQGLSVPDAIMVLGEMSTQVGYGSNVPYDCSARGCNGLKLFHSLHSWVGVVMVNNQWNEGVNQWLYNVYNAAETKWHIPKKFVAVIFLLLQLAASTVVYAADAWDGQGRKNTYPSYLMNALYMNLMSFSTVGYGDVHPYSDWGKVLTPVNLQLGTRLFSSLGEVAGATTQQDEKKLW